MPDTIFEELCSGYNPIKFEEYRSSGSGEEDFKMFLLFLVTVAILVGGWVPRTQF